MGPSPDQIRHDIDRTRAELVADANRIVDHTRPRNIAQRRVDRVRHRMSTVKERVMGTVPETASTLQDRTTGMASTVGERAQDAASIVGDKAQQAASTVGEKAQEAAHAVQQAPEQARQQARGNPLAAGLIAFGAGALVATLIPATRAEQDAVRQLGERAGGAVEPVKEALAESAQKLKGRREHRRRRGGRPGQAGRPGGHPDDRRAGEGLGPGRRPARPGVGSAAEVRGARPITRHTRAALPRGGRRGSRQACPRRAAAPTELARAEPCVSGLTPPPGSVGPPRTRGSRRAGPRRSPRAAALP